MDKIFLIGHRGVGKTTLLQDLKLKSKKYICYDLDQEIESRGQIKIQDLFEDGQEKKFRNLEIKILNEIIKEFTLKKIKSEHKTSLSHNKKLKSDKISNRASLQLVVSVGAGFQLEKFKFPKQAMVLWLRRVTDSKGRIFLNRPVLTKHSDPLKEWSELFPAREKKYMSYSNAQVFIPEYFDPKFNALYEYLNFKSPKHGFVTYLPKENDLILNLNPSSMELRSDLIEENQIFKILKSNPKVLHIVSIRNLKSNILKKLSCIKAKFLVDWDIALGLPTKEQLKYIDIYSSHSERAVEEILNFNFELLNLYSSEIKKLNYDPHFKICPLVSSHEDALNLDLKLSQIFDQLSYSFLPRSVGASQSANSSASTVIKDSANNSLSYDLSYLRQLKSYQQKIGFYRFGEGSSWDQPLWWQWPKDKPKGFYGIYGQNISHSYTPSFHFNFFKYKNFWPLSIDSLDQLLSHKDQFIKNDLKALAVTAPYKSEVYSASNFNKINDVSKVIKHNFDQDKNLDFKTANTLILSPKLVNKVDSFNTDYFALKNFLKIHFDTNQKTFVWGGGALLEQLKKINPNAFFYSARTGKPRTLSGVDSSLTKKVQLIWASGEKGLNPDVLNQKYTITKIIDLDYRDNSKAKLYSFINKIEYVSGLEFFVQQAQAQQSIWDNYEF